MSTNHGETEQTIRAAAATLVLLQGSAVELDSLLGGIAAPCELQNLRRLLCEGVRADRARALSTVLTAMALDLDDWRLG